MRMIKKITDFITAHRHIIVWTLCYFACMWVILRVLFGFNMLSAHDWWRLTHANIHGFAGFVFIILILAMIPMYTATTMVIARTGEPLFKITLPKLSELFKPAQKSDDAPADDANAKKTDDDVVEPELQTFPASLPNELKPAFRRARQYGDAKSVIMSKIAAHPIPAQNETTDTPDTGFALPDDFDFEPASTKSNDTPMFKDIDFDFPSSDDEPESAPIPAPEIPVDAPADTAEIEKHLESVGRKFVRNGDLILVDDMAVAAHCDSDFWIADDETWFATGKSKPSPIKSLNAAAARGLKPVLQLASQNIMDVETLRDTWEKSGIRIITSPDEL